METNKTADNSFDDLFRGDVEIMSEGAQFAVGNDPEEPKSETPPAAEQEDPAAPTAETKPGTGEEKPPEGEKQDGAQEQPPAETPGDNNAPEAQPEEDLTKTQAFSRRLKEMTSPLEQQLIAQKQELETLRSALGRIGYHGETQAVADQLISSVTGQTPEEIRAERENAAQAAKAQLEAAPEYVRMQQELEALRAQEQQRTFAEDLAAIKRINPAETAADIMELGDTFARLRANGIPTEAAYRAIADTRPKPPAKQPAAPPPAPGKVAAAPAAAEQLFTREQVLAMSQAEVMRNLDKIEKSERTWK